MAIEATREFPLVGFADVASAEFSPSGIERSRLRTRVLFARTSRGNYAKFQVRGGDDLLITRLTVYSPGGCIIKRAITLVIRSSFSCDLDEARESSNSADFRWIGVRPGVNILEPTNGAVFHECPAIEDVEFAQVRDAPYETSRIGRNGLLDQLVYCRTRSGLHAKLLVREGNPLRVGRLVVYDRDGSRRLDEFNIEVPTSYELALDSGQVQSTGGDLRWTEEPGRSYFLEPMNGAELSFDSHFRFEKYRRLVRNARIRAALIYEDAEGARPFSRWSDNERGQLFETLFAYETGAEIAITGPPELTPEHYIEACDAWKLYLAHVAQSLWVEANGRVSWSLAEASSEHLEHLLDSRKLLATGRERGHRFSRSVMGSVTHWNPRHSYDFLESNELIGADQRDTIERVSEWIRAHLFHIIGSGEPAFGGPFESRAEQFEYLFGYAGPPPVDRMISPLPDRWRFTDGCYGTDGFYAAVLRTVNVPVRHGRTDFNGGLHSRPEFFTVGLNLAHGDDPYLKPVLAGFNTVPIGELFYDDATLESEIDSPAALPGKTVAETASHIHHKRYDELGVHYKTDWILLLRWRDQRNGARGRGSALWDRLHEHYTDAEIAVIEADCDSVLATVPDGWSATAGRPLVQ